MSDPFTSPSLQHVDLDLISHVPPYLSSAWEHYCDGLDSLHLSRPQSLRVLLKLGVIYFFRICHFNRETLPRLTWETTN